MRGQLTVLTRGRLCNKLRVLLSGLHAARQTDRDLNVGWIPNPGCKMEFSDFFQPIKGMRVEADERNLADLIFDATRTVGSTDDVKKWNIKQNLLMMGCDGIHCGAATIADCVRSVRGQLKPTDEIVSEVESFAKKLEGPVVGLHIRATEHFQKITPLGKYEEVILSGDKDTKFYLSTDSQEALELMRSQYGKKILFKEKPLRSDTLEGMKGAIIDLYLLNRCKTIFGTRTSSYNWMASVIEKDVPLVAL